MHLMIIAIARGSGAPQAKKTCIQLGPVRLRGAAHLSHGPQFRRLCTPHMLVGKLQIWT
jgi:hypothetical protein